MLTVEYNVPIGEAPVVSITAPADASTFAIGDAITFSGTASDTEDGNLRASLSWESDLDDAIGSGGSFTTGSLSAGTHTIIGSVVDSDSQTGTAQITLTIAEPSLGNPPVANDDSITTSEETLVTIDVAGNDTDIDGNLDLSSANTVCGTCTVPENGTLVNNQDGTFDYTPDANFAGTDSFVYEICDGGAPRLCETAIVTITVTIFLESHFDNNAEGFVFEDDTFRNTSNPDFANGSYLSGGGFSGGGLQVVVGGIDDDDIEDMSGGWRQSFRLDDPQDVTLSFYYNLIQNANYESDEFSEALVTLDGNLIGPEVNGILTRLVGNGNGGADNSTGWVLVNLDLGTLTAGAHSITIGAFNNKKTLENESTQVLIDDFVLQGQ